MISDPGSTRGSSSRRVKASILPSPICSRVANRLEGEHCEMWDAPPAPPDPPTGSTTHQRDPRPHLQKSRTRLNKRLNTAVVGARPSHEGHIPETRRRHGEYRRRPNGKRVAVSTRWVTHAHYALLIISVATSNACSAERGR